LAVSGGSDSMTLLDAAAQVGGKEPPFFAVGHVEHGLRGRSSRADASFVQREARRRGLPFRLLRAPVKAFARRERLGTEEAARILRYRALARMARLLRCDAVLTAHTLDDQAETVVMNLIRGAGPAGLAGMAPVSPWPVPAASTAGLPLLRPFLSIRRREITRYLRKRKVPFRTDATNAQPLFFRNRIRPVLAGWDRERPGLVDRLGRLAEILRDEESFWEEFLGSLRRKGRGKGLALASFKKYHKVIQRRLLRRAFGLSSFFAVERARDFALGAGPAPRQSVPGGWIEKRGGRLLFRKLSDPPVR
jgi:tRNA(Ile)-lysidine synthase